MRLIRLLVPRGFLLGTKTNPWRYSLLAATPASLMLCAAFAAWTAGSDPFGFVATLFSTACLVGLVLGGSAMIFAALRACRQPV